jgi:hypothetical protein
MCLTKPHTYLFQNRKAVTYSLSCYDASLCSLRSNDSQSSMNQSGGRQYDTANNYGRNQPPARSRSSSCRSMVASS